eukprot:Gb_02225 [translate_table: standard]
MCEEHDSVGEAKLGSRSWRTSEKMSIFTLYIFYCVAILLPAPSEAGREWSSIGINYGRLGDNLPSPAHSVSLMKALKVGRVKLFDSDHEVLTALANSGLSVVIPVKDEEIPTVASSVLMADEWIKRNVLSHYPATKINTITVGNEILSDYNNRNRWLQLVPAMQNIHSSLVRWNLHKKIKVTTTVAMDALNSSSPPSSGRFRDDIAESVMKPLLRFISNTKSFYFVNVYPYFAWAANADKIPLEYAIFGTVKAAVQDGGLQYTDMLSAQLDANLAAMAKLGYPNVKIAISETGWPTAGGPNEVGANIDLAATYNRRLVARILANPPLGTPVRPRTFIPTYFFALFDEDNKSGPVSERNWGLLYSNGSEVYPIDMTGKLTDSDYESLKSVRPFPARPSPLPLMPTPIRSSISYSSPATGTGQNSPPTFFPNAPHPSPYSTVTPTLPSPPEASPSGDNTPYSSPKPSVLPSPPPTPYYPPPVPPYSATPTPLNPPTLPSPTINYPPPCIPYPPANPAPYTPSPTTPTTPITTPPATQYPPSTPTVPYTPNPPSTTPYTPYPPSTPSGHGFWCIAKPTVPISVMQQAMDYACGSGADCQSIQLNGPCYMPNTVVSHASYAFNSYWQKTKNIGGTCDFGGTAMLITMDPSFQECHFVFN